jgi:hypothetical protein
MYSVIKVVNAAEPMVVATKATQSEAMAAAAQLALFAAGAFALSRSTPQPSHYHKISVVINLGASVEVLCSTSTHPSVQIRWATQEADGRR